MTIWFASGNTHKKKELAAILDAAAGNHIIYELKIPAEANLVFNPLENGGSFRENALIKAAELYALLNDRNCFNAGDAIIADDSGLCVDALNGRPGIFSARYSGPPGAESQTALNDAQKNETLLEELAGNPRRSARFVCAMVLLFNIDRYSIVQETLEGHIVDNRGNMRGTNGFGYDPILLIPELGKTIAELSETEKNRISHRGKAGRVIADILFGNYNVA